MRPLVPRNRGQTPMNNREFGGITGLNDAINDELSELIRDSNLAQLLIRNHLRGRKVRFPGWVVAGKPRTGTIVEVSIWGKSLSVGVDVDRVDGRQGFRGREGRLADVWYGPVESVEVVG